ncbi:MAG: hypothetical protein KJ737_03410 [Proteobacteria bacterium]|nr:hypothetical protein [Pseudomonadota bacterium]
MVNIWQDLLGVSKIGVHDDFFLLGGQSLLAVSLISKINTEMNKDLPLSVLFQKSTIHDLAELIEKEQRPWSPLTAVRENGTQTPLFCFFPAGGNIYAYSDLANALDTDIPFYVLQAVGLEKGQTPINSVEKMAEYYIEWIKSVQPEGPFRLSGWSFGGLVAFEAARQLKSQGYKIDFLALFDSSAKNSQEILNLDMENNAAFMAGLFAEFITILPEELQGMSAEGQIRFVLEKAVKQGFVSSDLDVAQATRLLNVYKNNGMSAINYRAGAYDGEILLFKPEEESLSAFQYTEQDSQGWEEVTSDLKIYKVPGKHETMLMAGNVKKLAGILNNTLLKN